MHVCSFIVKTIQGFLIDQNFEFTHVKYLQIYKELR